MDSPIEHRIQRHIIGVLIHQKYARFRDLRPPKTDTNLFSYHLKVLLRAGLVEKAEAGYTLSDAGLGYVDRVSIKKLNVRSQPKIITMHVLQNKQGEILLQKRAKQPYIDTWTLPYGKTHISDTSIADAARRELREKLAIEDVALIHAGDAYIRVTTHGHYLSTTLAHVFSGTTDVEPDDTVRWVSLEQLGELELAPAVVKIVEAVRVGTPFFLELNEEWE